jgi:hypothetical protein
MGKFFWEAAPVLRGQLSFLAYFFYKTSWIFCRVASSPFVLGLKDKPLK